ncbi:MAG TPA: dihydroorotase [Synergistaceae bacterium]|nr:dihydroorotase [Synergistaceae bacterium]HPQ37571.1 dihydroorotase [Synergistaceae bacterium]
MKTVLFRAVRVFDGEQFREGLQDVLFCQGKVERIGSSLEAPEDALIVEGEGRLLAPAFIDLHTHLRDPGQVHREDIVSGSRAAAAGGFGAVVAMPNTAPPVDTEAYVAYVLQKGASAGGARVLPAGCVSKERKGEEMAELGAMAHAGAAFFTDDGSPVQGVRLLLNALLYAKDLGVRVMEHPQDVDLSKDFQVHEGRCSALSGMRGYPTAAEVIGITRGIALVRETGCPLHLTHVSVAQGLREIRIAKAEGLPVSCDVTPHHLVLSEEDVLESHLHAAFKVSPPLRSAEDVNALWEGLFDGTVDAIATDHAPWNLDEKDVPFNEAACGIASLECAFSAVFSAWKDRGCPGSLEAFLSLWTSRPGSLLPSREEYRGLLKEGSPAYCTLVDENLEKTVDIATWKSKAGMTPYQGRTFRGWPLCTLVAGELVYDALSGRAHG